MVTVPRGFVMAKRKQDFAAVDFENLSVSLSGLAAEVQAICDEMKASRIRSVPVDGAMKAVRAEALIRHFLGKAKLAVHQEKFPG